MINHRTVVTALSLALLVPASVALEGCASKTPAAAAKDVKGGGAKGAAAKGSGQKPGATATGARDRAVAKGATEGDATCDESLEGVAWCSSDTTVVFCQGGTFYELACGDLGGDVCAEDEASNVIDCVPVSEVE